MVAMLREQMVGLSLGRGSVGSTQNELQIVYQQCKGLWDTVPSEFHYSKDYWKALSPHMAIVSLVIHLEYLHTVFQVERLRCNESADATTDLLDSAMQIVSVVMEFAKHHDQKGSMWDQYTWIFLLYALPAAGVVATELHRYTVSRMPLPWSTSKSRIIRDLSVLISWFEISNSPTSHTHQACVEVTKVLTKLLNDTLDYPSGGQLANGPLRASGNSLAPTSDDRVRDSSHSIGMPLKAYEQGGIIPNVDALETSEDFLNWLDEFGLDTSVPEFFGCQ